jgi:hypothetical protein
MNPAIAHLPRADRKSLLNVEARRRASGDWGPWKHIGLPNGTGGDRWNKEVRFVHHNKVFAVLERPTNGAVHLAVVSLSGERPTFHEMQRIKNELAGVDATAVEVYPPQSELVDSADMYHIWVVDPLPFGIFDRERARAEAERQSLDEASKVGVTSRG